MDQRQNFLSLILLDALEDENERDIFNILRKNNIDASYVPPERGISPLHYVCGMENNKLATIVAKQFLESGVNPNIRTNENMTPLHVAALYGRTEIVELLLLNGAAYDLIDDENKTPLHYAIEECHFEVVQQIRDHIFEKKYRKKTQQQSLSEKHTSEEALPSYSEKDYTAEKCNAVENDNIQIVSNAFRNPRSPTATNGECLNKKLLAVTQSDKSQSNAKYTPNRIHYNYDVTSPYYINITHRRHRPQPIFPPIGSAPPMEELCNSSQTANTNTENINIFTLTKEHLDELANAASEKEHSHLSMIETWRDKVQQSRARQSILKQYDDVEELIDNLMENDHLNFTNTELKEKDPIAERKTKVEEVDSGACGSNSSNLDANAKENSELPTTRKSEYLSMSLGTIIQKVAQAHIINDFEPEPTNEPAHPASESSYQTVPEVHAVGQGQTSPAPSSTTQTVTLKTTAQYLQVPDRGEMARRFTNSRKSRDYFLQMAEAYVHTDDENGLVFYETRLLSNDPNKVTHKRIQGTADAKSPDDNKIIPEINMDATLTSQSTNITIPIDYETDALRTELTTFGEPPGPITKSTKRLYIKRLVKYKRNTEHMLEQRELRTSKEIQFSIELHRTVRSLEAFQHIADYLKYEAQSTQYFANDKQKTRMREGHLKQSFIYMLIDPRISCNLPGESVFLDKYSIWKRFLEAIFYVGKGKTSRPYSHLYDAMRTHSRMHNVAHNNEVQSNGKKISIRKQRLNFDLFKSPPEQATHSKKLDRILDIWSAGHGVVCLHVFHNIVPIEAYTREAAIIDALSLKHLTNVKRGNYYGPAKNWTMKDKKYLGIALLYKAMQIFLAEGESQLSPSDLI